MTRAKALATGIAIVALAVGAVAVVSGQTKWPSENPPRSLAAHAVQFPPYELRTLANGLQVVVVLHHEQPVVSMRMIVRAGRAADPRDKIGVAHLVAALLDQGTSKTPPQGAPETMSATELHDAIDFIGAEVNAGAGADLSFLNMLVMKDSFDTGLHLLSDMARHPAFDPAEIDRQRQQMLSTLEVSLDDPSYVANSVFDRLVYGFHPYGLPELGTPKTIASISRDDLVAFHDRHFAPNNALLAVVGDLTAGEAFDGVTRVLGDWQRREVPAQRFVAPPGPVKRVVVINKPDAVQTEVRVGQLGVKRNISDYMAVNLALRILGGEGANRLHQVLRTQHSLTYGAQAEMDTLKDSGDFEAETSTRTEATGEVVRLIIDEFWRIQRERVAEEELSNAKAYLAGSFPLTIETPNAIATQTLNVLFYGLPVVELQSFRERVNAVTVDDVGRVARVYLRPDRLSIVLVGNAPAFTPQLRRLGLGTIETVNMEDLDLTAANFKAAGGADETGGAGRAGGAGGPGADLIERALRPAVAAYQAQAATQGPQGPQGSQGRARGAQPDGDDARALLEKAIAAKGGFDTLRAVKSITAITRADADTPSGRVTAQTTTYLQYPNRVRVETKLPGETVVQVYDGSRAWVRDSRGTHDVPDRMARELDASFARDIISLLVGAREGRVRPRLLPDAREAGGQVRHALEFSTPSLEPTVLYIDPDTNLITSQTYVAGGPGQPLVEELFSDYKAVSGVQVAFTATVRQAGQAVAERRVDSIKFNVPLDSALFKRP
jgi:zinc protease